MSADEDSIDKIIARVDGKIALERRGRKVKRNSRCPCGSGLKHKRCCGRKSKKWLIEETASLSTPRC